jgi:very-short-patch-repair endonuclease
MQQQVFEAFEQLLGWHDPPQQEKLTDDDNFSIDIVAVTAAGVRLAVEVDGPSHFVSPGNRVNGPTQYRDRALKAWGYTVVSIPGWEWAQLKGTEQRQQYLLEKLKGELGVWACR